MDMKMAESLRCKEEVFFGREGFRVRGLALSPEDVVLMAYVNVAACHGPLPVTLIDEQTVDDMRATLSDVPIEYYGEGDIICGSFQMPDEDLGLVDAEWSIIACEVQK